MVRPIELEGIPLGGTFSGCMQTASGRIIKPFELRPEDITIEDIAKALSQLCRFAGHTSEFYSVGQHSILVSQVVPPYYALEALLHDAPEAFFSDIPRPVKHRLPDLLRLEEQIDAVVARKFGLQRPMAPCVKAADTTLLITELRDLMHESPMRTYWLAQGPSLPNQIIPYPPEEVFRMFMHQFRETRRTAYKDEDDV